MPSNSQTAHWNPLTRGRTMIEREHTRVGHVVHEAGDAPEYVHLSALIGRSLDANDDVVVVGEDPANQPTYATLRVVVGEHAEALHFQVNPRRLQETRLVDNLHLKPWESIYVSTSDPTAKIVVHGIVTRKPVVRS